MTAAGCKIRAEATLAQLMPSPGQVAVRCVSPPPRCRWPSQGSVIAPHPSPPPLQAVMGGGHASRAQQARKIPSCSAVGALLAGCAKVDSNLGGALSSTGLPLLVLLGGVRATSFGACPVVNCMPGSKLMSNGVHAAAKSMRALVACRSWRDPGGGSPEQSRGRLAGR